MMMMIFFYIWMNDSWWDNGVASHGTHLSDDCARGKRLEKTRETWWHEFSETSKSWDVLRSLNSGWDNTTDHEEKILFDHNDCVVLKRDVVIVKNLTTLDLPEKNNMPLMMMIMRMFLKYDHQLSYSHPIILGEDDNRFKTGFIIVIWRMRWGW